MENERTHRAVDERVRLVRVHRLDKAWRIVAVIMKNGSECFTALELDLAVGPARDLNDGVDDGSVVLIWVERNLVKC